MTTNAEIPKAVEIERAYQRRYDAEIGVELSGGYPEIDAYERSSTYQTPLYPYLKAARILANPLKVNPPHWQHGRVIYCMTRTYLDKHGTEATRGSCVFLDVGTAKGFSALMLAKAVSNWQSERAHQDVQPLNLSVWTVDIIDPSARVARNSVAELAGLMTLKDYMQPFLDSIPYVELAAMGGGSAAVLQALPRTTRIPIAIIDGKHTYDAVHYDAKDVADAQMPGDLVFFDDMHLPHVAEAVRSVSDRYRITRLFKPLPHRHYCIAERI